MKKLSTLLLFIFLAFAGYTQIATPYFRNANPTRATGNIGNGIPFGANATLGTRMQCFYPPGFLNAGNAMSGLVTLNRIYFFADTASVDTINYANLTITLGEYSSAPAIGFTWNTAAARQTNVVSGSGVRIVHVDTNWFYIDFQTPFVYDPSKFLLVDFTVGAQSPFLFTWLIKSGPTPGSYISAANATAATPNTLSGGGMPSIGFDPFTGFNNAGIERPLIAPGCATTQDVVVKVKNAGRNVINSVTVNWRVNGVLQTPTSLTAPIDTFGSAKNDTTFVLGSVNVATGPVDVVAYVSNPNSSTDPDLSNDTAYFRMGSSLNGLFTIGQSSPFQTVSSAVEALRTFGVCGPVTFRLDTGIFFEQVDILGRFNGASAANPVVFEGTSKELSVIASGSNVVNAKHIVKMQGAAYITFRNLTLRNINPTMGWGFHLLDSCKVIGIKNCIIDNSVAANSIANNNTAGISISGLPTGLCIPGPCATNFTTAAKVDSLEIDSNRILFGFMGINVVGNATTLMGNQIKIRNNHILNAYNNSINIVAQANLTVSGNTIIPRQTGTAGVGILVNGVNQTTHYGRSEIVGNKIIGYATAGISLNNHIGSDSINKSLIANNMIGGMAQLITGNGIVVTAARNWSISHNSINHDISGVSAITSSAIRMLGATTQMSVKNNIIAVTGNGISIPVHLLLAANVDSMDRNVFYRRDTSTHNQLINIAGTGFSFANFKGAAGLNLNSNFVKPDFRNDTSLYLNTVCFLPAAQVIPAITNDIDGTPRSATSPVVGAHEKDIQNNNLAVISLLNPRGPLQAGTTQMRVLVQNVGSNSINNFTLSYRLNGATPVVQPVTLSSALLPCDTLSVYFTGVVIAPTDSVVNFLIYSAAPNASTDADPSNDTLRTRLFTPLIGNYIIGGPNAAFLNFKEATDALRSSGVAGPVTFHVSPGVYNEQFTLTGPIAGLNASRRVVFEAYDTTDRILTFAGNVGMPHTLRIANASYVTVRNLKIVSTGAAAGWGVHLTGAANGIHIKNCAIGITGAGVTSTATSFMGITACGATITTANRFDSLEIDSNYINYGYQGINIYGGSGTNIGINNKIRNNTVMSAQHYSIYLVFQQTPELNFNNIFSRGATTGVGIYLQNVTTPAGSLMATRINGNRMANYGTAGLYLATCTNLATLKGSITNNAIGGMVRLAGSNSLYATGSTHWDIAHNSINHDFTTTTAATAAAIRLAGTATATTGISLFNNVIAVTGFGSAIPLYTQVLTNINAMDNNVFYRFDTAANNFMAFLGSNISAQTLRGFNNWNRHTIVYQPSFTSATNLMPDIADSFAFSMSGRAVYVPYAAADISGKIRPSNTWDGVPDIGAFEFTPTGMAPMARAFPDTAVAFGKQVFTFGFDTVASLTYGATLPGFIQVRQHSGVKPPMVDSTQNYMYFYTSFTSAPVAALELYYKDNWKGTHNAETGIWINQMDQGVGVWTVYNTTSSLDTIRNIMGLSAFSASASATYLSGSNGNATTVPVTLMRFTAHKENQKVYLNWITASEINSSEFIIEKSLDGHNFEAIASIAAQGNSSRAHSYRYIDSEINGNETQLFYRLKMLDKDHTFEYSNMVAILEENESLEPTIVVYPNPFSNHIQVIAAANASFKLYDVSGKEISVLFTQNEPEISSANLNSLLPGIYFLTIESNGKTEHRKLIKQ